MIMMRPQDEKNLMVLLLTVTYTIGVGLWWLYFSP